MKPRQIGLSILAASFLLMSACGDDNDTGAPPPAATNTVAPPPATATRTVTVGVATPTATVGVLPTDTPPVGPTETPPIGATFTPTATIPVGPTNTPGGTPGVCGNGNVDAGEECDDGNNFGGDGCAANCTTEVEALCTFGGASGATVQTLLFAIPLELTGSQTFTLGMARDEQVTTPDPELSFGPGEVPVTLTTDNINFDPVPVPGLVCACVRGVDTGEFGPNNAGAGRLGCGDQGLQGVDTLFVIDHNINDIDPNCETGTREDGTPEHPHAGVCNGPPQLSFSGSGGPGSAVVTTATSISLIQDGGLCEENCGIPAMGPDCQPCTEDDVGQAEPNTLPTTTGIAEAILRDANNVAGRSIARDATCGASPCLTQATGTPADCGALAADPEAGIAAMSLVSAFGALDSAQIGDNVVTSVFECVAP